MHLPVSSALPDLQKRQVNGVYCHVVSFNPCPEMAASEGNGGKKEITIVCWKLLHWQYRAP